MFNEASPPTAVHSRVHDMKPKRKTSEHLIQQRKLQYVAYKLLRAFKDVKLSTTTVEHLTIKNFLNNRPSRYARRISAAIRRDYKELDGLDLQGIRMENLTEAWNDAGKTVQDKFYDLVMASKGGTK